MKRYCEECKKEVETTIVTKKESYNVCGEMIDVNAQVLVCAECGEELFSEELDNAHQLHQFRFIKIKIGGFPIIQQSHTSLVPILYLIFTGPIMEITASLSFTFKTVSKIKIGSTEDFIRFQTIFRSIRINTRNNTQFVLIIYFEYKTEITCPS